MADLIPIRGELLINGTWTDVTSRIRGPHAIQIQDGSSAEQSYLTSGSCSFSINNADGTFTDTNPYSPYMGQLGRNTQFRVGLKGTKYVRMIGSTTDAGAYDGARVYTADKAALDIAGDIDIRFDADCEDWIGSYGQILAGKWNGTTQQSWMLFTQQGGDIYFLSTTDGTLSTGYLLGASYPNQAFATSGRQAIRVTWDVDNGAGANTVTWYKAATIAGPWTQVAQTTSAGTKTIYSGTAPLEVGTVNNGGGRYSPYAGVVPFIGKVYGFELRSGINGTVVASMDATGQARNATTWADAYTNTWICDASAYVDDMDYRFWGECAQLPQEWDTSGRDVWSPIQAGDLLQRLQSGQRAFASPIYRNLVQWTRPNSTNAVAAAAAPYVTGYWPMEDNVGAVKGRDASVSLSEFTNPTGIPGTTGVLGATDDLAAAYWQSIPVDWPSPTVHVAYFSWFQEYSGTIGGTYLECTMQNGTLGTIRLTMFPASHQIDILRTDNSVWKTYNSGYGGTLGRNSSMTHRVMLTHDTGANTIKIDWNWNRPGDTVYYTGVSTTQAAGTETVGKPRAIYARGNYADRKLFRYGHLMTAQTDAIPFISANYLAAGVAYFGETAFERFGRLMTEEGIDYWIRGIGELEGSDLNPPMGRQSPDLTVTDLAKECAEVVGGILYGPRDKFGLGLRMLSSMSGRDWAAPVLYYGTAGAGKYHLSGQLKPGKVTQNIRNYVVASRPDGAGTQISEKVTGPLNTSDPKLGTGGVGMYNVPITRNVATDDFLQVQANWERGVGTEDALRWPNVQIELHRAPFLADPALASRVRALNLGDPFVISGMPVGKGGPDDVSILYRGRTETLSNMLHTIAINAVPGGPYQWGQYASRGYQEGAQRRLDSSSSTTAAGYAAGVTSMRFAMSNPYSAWSRSTPYDVRIAGEQCTVTQAGSRGSIGGDLGQFEQNSVSGWTPSGGTTSAAIDATRAKFGTYSAKLTVAGTPTAVTYLLSSNANYAPVVVGNSYTVTAWIYSSIAITTNAWVFINWHTSANAYISTSGSVSNARSVAANTWTKLTFTATAPATAAKANFGPQVAGSPANGTTFNFDSIELIDPTSNSAPVVVTRAVNSISKTLPSGSSVRIVQSMRWGRI